MRKYLLMEAKQQDPNKHHNSWICFNIQSIFKFFHCPKDVFCLCSVKIKIKIKTLLCISLFFQWSIIP